MAITFVITNAGRNALVNAANTGTAPVTITHAGLSASAVAPSPTTANLPGEFKRIGTLSGDIVADDTIHLIVRDESSDIFTLRSIALYLADGTLFGIYGQSEILLEKSAQALMLLAVDIRFEDVAAGNISFGNANFLNPPATTERQGVIELATVAEAQAGNDATRAVTPAAAKSSVLNWLGFTPVHQGTGVGQLGNTIKIGWSGSRVKATVDVTDQGGIVFDANLASGTLGMNGAYVARAGFHLWGPDNDGSGSGLDADLLDGQHGSFYTDIASRLGYAPLQQGGGIGQGINKIYVGWGTANRLRATVDTTDQGYFVFDSDLGGGGRLINGFFMRRGNLDLYGPDNDGAGSGLDADLLDGQDGSFYANIPARLGFMPLQQGGGAGQSVNKIFIGWSGSRLKADVDGNDQGNIVFDSHVADVWRSSNDGAGSGLDADLLDGKDGAYYADVAGRLGFGPVQQGGGIGQGGNKIYLGWGAAERLKATVDITDQGYFVFDSNLSSGTLGLNGAYVARTGFHLWGPDNDGSGSGLDADLLDGQDGGFYANIPARLGYVPLQQGGGVSQTPNTVKIGWSDLGRLRATVDADDQGNFVFDKHVADVWRSNNDGSGSGLDADLLDGQDGSFYSNIPARLGYTPIQQGGGVAQTPNTIRIGWSGFGRLRATVDADDQGNFVFDKHVADVWRSSNDGSGSGLDADLLDGQDGGFYADIPARLGYAPASRGGDAFVGPVSIYYAGDPSLTLDSAGVGIGRLVMQSDGNLVLYRSDGATNGPIFTVGSLAGPFAIQMPITRQGHSVWDAGNDGSGSGLDADLLDGQHGSYYADIPARLGYTPLQQGGGVGQGANKVFIGWGSTNRLKATVDATDQGHFVFDSDLGGGIRLINGYYMRRGSYDLYGPDNDGAGSGLDADLLDGRDGNYYSDVIARLGYTPINKSGDTFVGPVSIYYAGNASLTLDSAGVGIGRLVMQSDGNLVLYRSDGGTSAPIFTVGSLAGPFSVQMPIMRQGNIVWDAGNDGGGSGLDADLLDGQQGSYYADVASRLGFMPIQQGGGVGQNVNKIRIGWSGSRLKADVDGTDQGNVVFDSHVADVWRSSNDGSGSGLDADLLDGHQADAFTRIVSQNMAAIDGYRVFADGTKECWTRIAIGQHQYATWNLPVAHESFVHPSLGCTTAGGNTEVQDNTGITAINGDPPTSITFWNADDRTITVYVRTIGR